MLATGARFHFNRFRKYRTENFVSTKRDENNREISTGSIGPIRHFSEKWSKRNFLNFHFDEMIRKWLISNGRESEKYVARIENGRISLLKLV